MMHCAECGSKMERHTHGAWVICCSGIGYWYNQQPTAEDIRNYGWPVSVTFANWREDNMPFNLPTFWFYPTAKWPKHRTPHPPRL